MIDAEIKGAIALLTVNRKRGTAFLVSDTGLVLTAAHCLRYDDPSEGAAGWIDAKEASLRFGEPGQNVVEVKAKLPPEAYDLAADWALLRCSPPPSIAPLVLSEYDGVIQNWDCWGFPTTILTDDQDEADYKPLSYDGGITETGAVWQLRFNQLGKATRVAGMSGAPVLVGREVVAIVGRAVEDEDRLASEPILFARPLPAERLRASKIRVRRATFPFEALLAGLLLLDTSSNVDRLVQKFGLSSSFPSAERRRAVVRHLLCRGPKALVGACNTIRYVDYKRPDLVGHLLAVSCWYLNTGTWANLMSFPVLSADRKTAIEQLRTFAAALKGNEREGEFKPSYVRLDLQADERVDSAHLHFYDPKLKKVE